MSHEAITLLKASQMAESFHEDVLFGLCLGGDNKARLNDEVDQLICIAADHLSIARHTLKLAYLKESK